MILNKGRRDKSDLNLILVKNALSIIIEIEKILGNDNFAKKDSYEQLCKKKTENSNDI